MARLAVNDAAILAMMAGKDEEESEGDSSAEGEEAEDEEEEEEDEERVDAFFEAIRKGELGTVRKLVDEGVDPNCVLSRPVPPKGMLFDTVLGAAASEGNSAIVKLLLQERGAWHFGGLGAPGCTGALGALWNHYQRSETLHA